MTVAALAHAGRTKEPALVDVPWLAQHAADKDVVVLQVDGDSSSYYHGHLPEALPLDWYDEVHDSVRRGPVSQQGFEQLMQRKGITEDTHVVLGGVVESAYAAHAFWLLRYYRHPRLSLLDGGLAAWQRAGLDVEAYEPSTRPVSSYHSPGCDPSLRATRDEILGDYVGAPPGTLVLDCRTPAEYDGRSRNPMDLAVEHHRVGGHIPGAVSLPSALLQDENHQFRDRTALRELLNQHGLAEGLDVVVYCRVAERSSLLWFTTHELVGHPTVRHYDGGWAEYGSLMNVPVARDDNG